MTHALVTGGSGFFGGILKRRLLSEGVHVFNIDLQDDEDTHPLLTSFRGDIRDESQVNRIFDEHRFDAVFHCAAILAHAVKDQRFLWTSNVDGTRIVAEAARATGVPNLIFTSSNCLWGMSTLWPNPSYPAPWRSTGARNSKVNAYSIGIATI